MSKFTTKQIVFSAMAIALATVISVAIKLPSLPNGGSITLFSMLIICLIGYWYGPKVSLIAAIAYGILQFIVGPYVVHPLQVALDYPLAFGALGLSGLFCNKKFGLQIGYVIGVVGRFVCSTLSGVIFFADYAPEGMNPWIYSIAYQGSYLGVELVLTLIIISIPPVAKALSLVKSKTKEI